MNKTDKLVKITVTKHLRLSGLSSDLRQDLVERLTLDNPKWFENERMGRWNRKTPKVLRFYFKTTSDGLLVPRGYVRQLIYLFRKNGILFEIKDGRRVLPEVAFEFSGRLKLFQQEAVDIMLEREFGTLSAPTGCGKTVMALYMVAMRKQPALIVVHTKDLGIQWIERVSDFLGIPEDEVGFIGSGKKKIGEKITIALVQSLYKCAEEVSDHIGYVIVDECHRIPSRTFTDAVTEFDSKYMTGLSATPWRRDKLSKLIFWHLGDTVHEMKKSDLVESGDVLTADIVYRETDFTPYFDPVNEYTKMLSELTADEARNHLIADDVAKEAGREESGICVVLSDRKKHCEVIQSLLKFKHKIDAVLLTGDVPVNERKEIFQGLNNEKIKVLLATGQLIGEGFDCKHLTTLFLATPIRFNGRVLQYLGRVLRPAPGKEKARVYDYVDVNVDVLKVAARSRQGVYKT
ncbi:MAG: DEAD/DEAH box helicase [Desulfobacterales bacterium]|nr:DEAD/DEAH box helicase [Desulfobacterales bacterium]